MMEMLPINLIILTVQTIPKERHQVSKNFSNNKVSYLLLMMAEYLNR